MTFNVFGKILFNQQTWHWLHRLLLSQFSYALSRELVNMDRNAHPAIRRAVGDALHVRHTMQSEVTDTCPSFMDTVSPNT